MGVWSKTCHLNWCQDETRCFFVLYNAITPLTVSPVLPAGEIGEKRKTKLPEPAKSSQNHWLMILHDFSMILSSPSPVLETLLASDQLSTSCFYEARLGGALRSNPVADRRSSCRRGMAWPEVCARVQWTFLSFFLSFFSFSPCLAP